MANDRPKRRNTLKNYNVDLMCEPTSDDEGAEHAVPQQTVDHDSGSEDDYKVDASNQDEDDEEEMAVDNEVNMKDELDIGVPEKNKPAKGTSRGKKAADEDNYDKYRANWPIVRKAGYHIAHPPFETLNATPTGTNKGGNRGRNKGKAKAKGKGQSKDVPNSDSHSNSDSISDKSNVKSTVKGSASSEKPLRHIQRAWMNSNRSNSKYRHLGFQDLFCNNSNRLQEGGPMNHYTEYHGKVGMCLKKEGLHPNLTQKVLLWLRDKTGTVGWPETIEERQLVRCDENFGEHLHKNPDGHRSIACSHAHVPSEVKTEYRLEGDFLFCYECAGHQYQELTSDEANAIQNGALAPMCEECAVKYATSDEAGFGTLECDCDLEPRCLEHRKEVLQGLNDSLAAFCEKHKTEKRRGAHDRLSDGCPTAKCPACRKNTPPPVGTHFAYMCVNCKGAVVIPPPGDANAWKTGGPRQLQDFIVALGRPHSHANLQGIENERWSAIMDAYIQDWEAKHGPCKACMEEATNDGSDDDDDDDNETSIADPPQDADLDASSDAEMAHPHDLDAEQRALDQDILAGGIFDAMDVDDDGSSAADSAIDTAAMGGHHPTRPLDSPFNPVSTTHASGSGTTAGTKRKRAASSDASDGERESVPGPLDAARAMLPPPTPGKRQKRDGGKGKARADGSTPLPQAGGCDGFVDRLSREMEKASIDG